MTLFLRGLSVVHGDVIFPHVTDLSLVHQDDLNLLYSKETVHGSLSHPKGTMERVCK